MSNVWPEAKLGDVCKTGAGGTPLKSVKEYHNGGTIPWLLSGEVSQGEIHGATKFITQMGLENSSAKLFPPNSVLVAMYGATAGQLGILRIEATTNQAICAILPNPKLLPEFIYYALLSKQSELISAAVGNAQPNISQVKVKNTIIPIPPLPEQKCIVAILDEAFAGIDRAIANTEKNLVNAREVFESYVDGVFTQKGGDWNISSLTEIAENLDSKRVPITKSNRKAGDVPYYGASGIVDHVEGFLFDEELLLVSEDGANLLARTYPIAFSISGKSWVNNHAHVLRFSEMSTQKFVEFYLNSISLESWVSGMAQPKLNQKALNSIPILVPPLAVQIQVVETMQQLQGTQAALEDLCVKKLASLSNLKQSILQKAFSGELTAKPDRILAKAGA